jgi:hypothetical protein
VECRTDDEAFVCSLCELLEQVISSGREDDGVELQTGRYGVLSDIKRSPPSRPGANSAA